jgi:hypothetical protein
MNLVGHTAKLKRLISTRLLKFMGIITVD